jgi:hypothetical protein
MVYRFLYTKLSWMFCRKQITDKFVPVRYPHLLPADKAVVLQIGHRFFTVSHCFTHSAWYLWPHSRVPMQSAALYSSCKIYQEQFFRTTNKFDWMPVSVKLDSPFYVQSRNLQLVLVKYIYLALTPLQFLQDIWRRIMSGIDQVLFSSNIF